jgi:hypothetical protein
MAASKIGWKLEEVVGEGVGVGASVGGTCNIVDPGELVVEMRGGKRNKTKKVRRRRQSCLWQLGGRTLL